MAAQRGNDDIARNINGMADLQPGPGLGLDGIGRCIGMPGVKGEDDGTRPSEDPFRLVEARLSPIWIGRWQVRKIFELQGGAGSAY